MFEGPIYTAITFSPVQGFIEKSRKLRDLYGSSFLLSYLACAICHKAQQGNHKIVSPALLNLTQGTPNQIIIKTQTESPFTEEILRKTFISAWERVVKCCQLKIEEKLPEYKPYSWNRAWNACVNHTWEFFWAETSIQDKDKPDRIGDARRRLNEVKRWRDWTGINWGGESSTLSGADAIAWPHMVEKHDGLATTYLNHKNRQKEFYKRLSEEFGESIISPNERLSIPELIKRLITLDDIAKQLDIEENKLPSIEIPKNFSDINRHQSNPHERRWTAWFQGDGDCIGEYLKALADTGQNEDAVLTTFSTAMMEWGKNLRKELPDALGDDGYHFIDDQNTQYLKEGRIIYAGGDDFFGVLYRNYPQPEYTPKECLNWFYNFSDLWRKYKDYLEGQNSDHGTQLNFPPRDLTVSVGLVWAAPGIPQRDVLQHCREAEKLAKHSGRDRIAIRVLFNGGNYLEWTCPWHFLRIFEDYRDRNGKVGEEANWTHIFSDIAALEARHGFRGNVNVALGIIELYFGQENKETLENQSRLWNNSNLSGILGDKSQFVFEKSQLNALNSWVINLAKVGFHLHRTYNNGSLEYVAA